MVELALASTLPAGSSRRPSAKQLVRPGRSIQASAVTRASNDSSNSRNASSARTPSCSASGAATMSLDYGAELACLMIVGPSEAMAIAVPNAFDASCTTLRIFWALAARRFW